MAAPNFPELEEKLLKEWEEKGIFKKTLEKDAPKGDFVFFEGPPTANGKPGIHHVLARAFKDLIPRFKTMQGYRVDRKAGWDTHGLPVELEVEKQLGLKNKKDVEAYGVEKFNEKCRESVWKYLDEWVKMTQRMGYWVDLEHPYVTYKNEYVESVWNIVSEIEKRGLLYKGHKIVPYCARCGTALSSHEVAQGYKEVTETSVYVRFKVKGEPGAYFLAWTTTPWTLPSNTALAVGPDITYVKVKSGGETYYLAQDRLNALEGGADILEILKGSDLVGMEYEPLFSFLPLSKPAHRVVPGSFVSTTDGSGIVHMAPFGEDDMEVIKKNDFPVLMTVGLDGAFIPEVTPWAGRFVKDADKDIIADLASRGLLYKEEDYTHDYPFCWRCSTPLLYYPKDSWFIAMSRLQKELIANNEKINWEPAHIKEGRFGEWLRGIKDWAISRDRYWGTPLPLWECECGKVRAIGSLEEMNERRFRKNRFLVVRHGEAVTNAQGTLSSWPEKNGDIHLTEDGKKIVGETAEALGKEKVDLIVASDLLRTKETAEIIRAATGAEIVYDERLREIDFGEMNGRKIEEFESLFVDAKEKLTKGAPGGESLEQVRARVVAAVLELDRAHQGKTIALVTHGDPIWALETALSGDWSPENLYREGDEPYPKTGRARELKVPNWPFDHKGLLDVHKPFIDAVTIECECGKEMKRVPEVMDVWFDSGAMPFAQWHYPFENKEKVDGGAGYPADFISEAIDQTRGWFYTLLAVSTLLGREPAYKNVICLGHLLDAKGQKMSKSKGNVVNPWDMFAKYGADAVRFHLFTVNQPGEAKRFDEKEVDGVVKKLFLILWNVLSFWKMYVTEKRTPIVSVAPAHVLDRWVLSELAAVTKTVTESLEKFDVVTAGRAIGDFTNDLSTWYLRRSRDRFKSGTEDEKISAVATLGRCLLTVSKLLAPFTPHVAEGLYQELGGEKESVHLDGWPEFDAIDENLTAQMKRVRQVCSAGLEKRAAAGIPVRQALAKLTIKGEWLLETWMLDIIAEEVNVKEACYEKSAATEVELDTTLTPELKREGAARELTRAVNSMRKEARLTIQDRVTLLTEGLDGFWKEVMDGHGASVLADVKADGMKEGLDGALATGEVESDGQTLKFGIIKK
ncbi:MAG TPA: class I tRNA ligase family protein [Candidatus Baltobacteraceae bacterium]|nr:class I tRNA ligase family protein [Candidatus Baltobacteraceae bacterium]